MIYITEHATGFLDASEYFELGMKKRGRKLVQSIPLQQAHDPCQKRDYIFL